MFEAMPWPIRPTPTKPIFSLVIIFSEILVAGNLDLEACD
jgi:hypothetical protein